MAFLGISGFFENIGIILEDMWSCKLRTFLSLFGIMWGTISVVLLLSLGQSFYQTSQVRLSPLVDGAIAGMPGFTGKKSKKLFGKTPATEQYYHQIFFHYVLQDGQRAHCAWDRAR